MMTYDGSGFGSGNLKRKQFRDSIKDSPVSQAAGIGTGGTLEWLGAATAGAPRRRSGVY